MPGDAGRLVDGCGAVARTQEGAVRHHELDLDRLHLTRREPGQQPQRGVCGHGSRWPVIGDLVGTLPAHDGGGPRAHRCVGPHDLAQGAEHREVRHTVRGGTDGDPTRGD